MKTKKIIENFAGLETFALDYVLFTQYQYEIFFGLHVKMFIPLIMYLGSDSQKEKWLPKCKTFEMVGCYGQTELGHGSDVQSLETTAVYDSSSETFTINTPTLTAMKYWPGDLGITCNHAAVHAQLIIDRKKYGIQTFIVPIRDPKTLEPLPGIEVGDIGPKLGFATKDNGYLIMKNIKIPRDNMLCRYAKVSKEGKFSIVGNEKVGYTTMLEVRDMIVGACPILLSRAICIAIRYSLVRRQFKGTDG